MKNFSLTIHTATFNRGHLIESAYKSLKEQTCHNFEWVVVDDGSTDNTEELFNQWVQAEGPFPIVYSKQHNQGVARARNKGLELARGEYFFILDSDDYLTPDAVSQLLIWMSDIAGRDDFVGVGALRGDSNLVPLKGSYPMVDNESGYVDATNLERARYNMDVDMCEAYKTSIIRKFPFPVWPGEKFAPEALTMNEMALRGYKLRWHPKVIYVCEYQELGLTKGSWNLERSNPMGYAMLANHKLKYGLSFMNRLRMAARFIALSIVGNNCTYIRKSNAPFLTMLILPYGIALSWRKARQYKMEISP